MTQHMPHQSFQMVLPFKHAALSFLGGKNSKDHTAALPIAGDTLDLIFINVS